MKHTVFDLGLIIFPKEKKNISYAHKAENCLHTRRWQVKQYFCLNISLQEGKKERLFHLCRDTKSLVLSVGE